MAKISMHDCIWIFLIYIFTLQVLHPQSMRPAREGDIPVRVKNSYNPNAPGTLITRTRDMSKVCSNWELLKVIWKTPTGINPPFVHFQAELTSIVLKRNITMLDIVSTRMLGQFGFLAKVRNLMIIFSLVVTQHPIEFCMVYVLAGIFNIWRFGHIGGCCGHQWSQYFLDTGSVKALEQRTNSAGKRMISYSVCYNFLF